VCHLGQLVSLVKSIANILELSNMKDLARSDFDNLTPLVALCYVHARLVGSKAVDPLHFLSPCECCLPYPFIISYRLLSSSPVRYFLRFF